MAKRRAIRDLGATPGTGSRDGGGGTVGGGLAGSADTVITGGPRAKIDLAAVLSQGAPCASRGGAVSGAAQVAFIAPAAGSGALTVRHRGIALSDGSRIIFASLAAAGTAGGEDALLLEA